MVTTGGKRKVSCDLFLFCGYVMARGGRRRRVGVMMERGLEV